MRSSSCRTFSATAVDAISELFVREIRKEIDDTGVKAAFIKGGRAPRDHRGHPKILAAVSTAAIETGVPVMAHTRAALACPRSRH